MSDLNKLFESHPDAERVIGTYFYPIRYFGTPDPTDPYAATEVIASATVDSREVLITRMSGLFIQPPTHLSDPHQDQDLEPSRDDFQAKLDFEIEAVQAFNRVICEFCLHGVVSEPTSPTHVSYAQLIDGHILVRGGGGAGELYLERTMGPALALHSPFWLAWQTCAEVTLEKAIRLDCSKKLADISQSIPELVAGAYSYSSQGQANEALIDSWIVCEQLLDRLWHEYQNEIKDALRRERLDDTRTYSAAVRLEVLRTAGGLSDDLYQALNRARAHRNALAHRAKNSFDAVSECVTAMKLMLEDACGHKVEAPATSRGVNW